MAELEGRPPNGRWSLSAFNFPSSCYFRKIFGMHFQKGLVYFYAKTFLPLLLHFWNYNLSPNGKMVSLVGAQACPQTQLLGAEWYKVLKIIHCGIFPTE